MTGKMEAGEGRGGPSREGSPFLPKLLERFASLPEVFRLVGRRRGGAVGWGWARYGRFLWERPCQNTWLFHLHSTVKVQPFYPFFPLAGSTDKAFCRLSLLNFKEKSINHFL